MGESSSLSGGGKRSRGRRLAEAANRIGTVPGESQLTRSQQSVRRPPEALLVGRSTPGAAPRRAAACRRDLSTARGGGERGQRPHAALLAQVLTSVVAGLLGESSQALPLGPVPRVARRSGAAGRPDSLITTKPIWNPGYGYRTGVVGSLSSYSYCTVPVPVPGTGCRSGLGC